jgi:hypothetical protein
MNAPPLAIFAQADWAGFAVIGLGEALGERLHRFGSFAAAALGSRLIR